MGAVFIVLNIARLMKDRRLNGVHWLSTTYFTSWGFWNLFYYPSLDQWWSFAGGAILVTMNTGWLLLVAYYAVTSDAPDVD